MPLNVKRFGLIPPLSSYVPKNRLRFVTATSLFDGHDASINIIRRLLQNRGAEVIHLGHNRTAREVAFAALEEDVHGLALSSYQGGHVEYFLYLRKLLDENGGSHIKIFGGGGGVITPEEIETLESQGVCRIFSPEDGQALGLEGMIGSILKETDGFFSDWQDTQKTPRAALARGLSLLENGVPLEKILAVACFETTKDPTTIPVLGITGTGGSGKSSLLDEILLRCLMDFPDIKIGLICIDPSKKKTGGALLGDRLRINACDNERVFLRSLASRGSKKELSQITKDGIALMKQAGFDLVIVESSGIGQGDSGILDVSDRSLYVMTPEYGASSQLEKIDMLDYADWIAINKFERRQGPDSLRDVRNLLRRNRFKGIPPEDLGDYQVYGTIASRFNDDGVSGLYRALMEPISKNWRGGFSPHRVYALESTQRGSLIPTQKEGYLAQIAQCVRDYKQWAGEETARVKEYESLIQAGESLGGEGLTLCHKKADIIWDQLSAELKAGLLGWPSEKKARSEEIYTYQVRGKPVENKTIFTSLSSLKLPKVALPNFESQTDLARWLLLENLPGVFPYTAGLYPYKRTSEDPKRQFAGEGGPLRTNGRFHYLCQEETAKRLSTAFDSVTLYGSDPDERPDIYGKIGESGVSIAHVDDMKLLYRGFRLLDPMTSVSMTINGPAPVILAMFFQTALSQEIEGFEEKNKRPASEEEKAVLLSQTLRSIRGTVQADILKEDQAQNTCLFSTEFALKMMGDIQEYFIQNKVRNYYGVSISGYHIAEAGANPITQLALTLANGFTYVEYYLARGLPVDEFAPNLSFFFSNGLDPEYTVLGRVARRIWAIAMKNRYGAHPRSQQLKYHIQTSGRSLHAQEMDFNDIRTTLQALMAITDQCNSLHTNAFDEALTTPTESSVRRAMAIQMIIIHELGLAQCENFHQGSFFVTALHEAVEEAVLMEFDRLSERGGVLGAMETQYQRSKIQEESLYYEHLKHSGGIPIIGVNRFFPREKSEEGEKPALTRASYEEKNDQLARLREFQAKAGEARRQKALEDLAACALSGGNIFAELMNTVGYASLGDITQTLAQVGGRYRRSM
jgi:methylmalonyl-CoA mutase